MRNTIIRLLWLVLLAAPTLFAIDNLKLNPHLDYGSDSLDGPLITGTNAQSGFVSGKTNYVIMYGEGCLNSKRQARRTVELYDKYAPRCILWSSILMFSARQNSRSWSRSTTRDTSLMSSYWMRMAIPFTTKPSKWTPELPRTLKFTTSGNPSDSEILFRNILIRE
jgi:hypothetical protein